VLTALGHNFIGEELLWQLFKLALLSKILLLANLFAFEKENVCLVTEVLICDF
jgi:hypothetical protein